MRQARVIPVLAAFHPSRPHANRPRFSPHSIPNRPAGQNLISMADESKKDLFDLDAISSGSVSDLPDGFFQDDEFEVEGDKYVVFQINDEHYAVPSEDVSEVVRMLPLTVIPNLPDWFLGIGNLRGDIVSVIDFAGYWEKAPGEPSQKSKLIVLQSESSETNVALRVDRLREVVSFSKDKIEALDDGKHPYLVGIAQAESAKINFLDPATIVSSLTLR